MQPGGQAPPPSSTGFRSRHAICNGRWLMGQLIELFGEGLQAIGVPVLGLLLWSVRPVLFTLVVLAGFAAGFGLAFAVH
jgi:hypothetical protein